MPKWKTRDGRELEIDEMSDDHLINAFNLCQHLAEDVNSPLKQFIGIEWALLIYPEIKARGLTVKLNDAIRTAFQEESYIWNRF